jgi:ferritin-like metal-binding protein YciE
MCPNGIFRHPQETAPIANQPGKRPSRVSYNYSEVNVARDREEALNSYITDMLSLEEHIEKALRGQVEDLKGYPEVTRDLKQILQTVEHHVSDLKDLSDRRKAGGPSDAIKRAGSTLLGLGAAAIDMVRNEGLPKNLRDDYTAFSLATIGYVMLQTSALALEDQEVSELARQHFADCARAVILLHNLIPGAVIRFLREDGLPVREDVLPEVSRTIEEIWQSRSAQAPRTEETAAGRIR